MTRGAKVSRERPGSFVLLMTQTVSSVTQRRQGRGQLLLWSLVIAKQIRQHYCGSVPYNRDYSLC